MSKKPSPTNSRKSPVAGIEFVSEAAGVEEYLLKSNGLRILFHERRDTDVVTTNITYFVGARDEERGETGLAHMLEHMLFKPTANDLKNKIEDGSAMRFERETGCILNANTWKDRTTYFFCSPTEHLDRMLALEADRMQNVVLTDETLKPEQGNVLSEFDMYGGRPDFTLAVQMVNSAFHSHPYGHETIGFREDIEDYNAEKLQRFYKNYYRPDNAVMMVVGDVDKKLALELIKKHFAELKNPATPIPRFSIREPKQEGMRRVTVERPSTTNLVSIGFKHEGFPSHDWFVNDLMLDTLTSGPESILHKLLVDTGKASSVASSMDPSSHSSLGVIEISLAQGQSHSEIEHLTLRAIESLTLKEITPLLKKAKIRNITDELFARTSSMHIAQELTEYVSAGDWNVYAKTTEILNKVSPKMVLDSLKKSFNSHNLTIGHFVGTK
ncbi:insulinase family protein [Candidatus Kaiserbacteria bacterium]|nr:insulinase family protein [Candidatus Kaiserbacteria bacterium]